MDTAQNNNTKKLQSDLSLFHSILRNAFNCVNIALGLLAVSRYYRNNKSKTVSNIFILFSCGFLIAANYLLMISLNKGKGQLDPIYQTHMHLPKMFIIMIFALLLFEAWLIYNSNI